MSKKSVIIGLEPINPIGGLSVTVLDKQYTLYIVPDKEEEITEQKRQFTVDFLNASMKAGGELIVEKLNSGKAITKQEIEQ